MPQGKKPDMQAIKLTRQSPFTAQQMFDLITDVDRYDEFIPYCTAARVRERTDTEMLADLAIGYKMLRETYSSRIELAASPLTVTVHQAKGPFRHLFNQWVLEDTETGCTVHFELQFEFAVPLLRRIIQPIMNRVVERFVAAFETRALEIYG
ncbi:MAG: type II toxin-antitoxin system RatA family toxin [Alphaproteobacteria bacterium]|nr:type II toxin-antitoxin system RatA family toxin [Alphaproteobacteria bacterium]